MENLHKYAEQILRRALEDIDSAMRLTCALQKGIIKPGQLPTPLLVDRDNREYQINSNWTKHPDSLQTKFANMIRINVVSYAKSYVALFYGSKKLEFATQESNPDLYAAQTILMLIRNTLEHFKSPSGTLIASATWKFDKAEYIGIFCIKEIDVMLDTTNLQGKRFEWDCFKNGFKDFRKMIQYLRNYHQTEAKNFANMHILDVSKMNSINP